MRAVYVQELESVRQNLVEMGETTLSLLAEALDAIADPRPDPSPKASELEARTDHQYRFIHDRCVDLITLQAPVAGDARLITGTLDAIVDLELIGDYASEIVLLSSATRGRPPSQVSAQMVALGAKIQECLSEAVDSWRNLDRAQGLSVRPQAVQIRAECGAFYAKLSRPTLGARVATANVNLMQISRHLERIVRHAANIGDQAADAAPSVQDGGKAPATLAQN